MLLSKLLKNTPHTMVGADVEIHEIEYDSRKVEKGDLFSCVVGTFSDGHKYAESAVEKGAAALLVERERQFREGPCTDEIEGYTNFVFTNRHGHVHAPQAINRALERIRVACNEWEAERAKKERREPVVVPHFSVHNLRHTFCTRFCENETNIKVIQEIMGHADIGTTMNIYAEATEQKKKESFSNLEGKIKIS